MSLSPPPPLPSSADQRTALSSVWSSSLNEGETWSVLDAKWCRMLSSYLGFDLSTGLSSDPKSFTPPPPIENSLLKDGDQKDIAVLKKPLLEHSDFEIVNSQVANFLYTWYGGGPRFDRTVISLGLAKSTQLDFYPKVFRLVSFGEDGAPQEDSAKVITISTKKSLGDLRKQVLQMDDEKLQVDDLKDSDWPLRFWLSNPNKTKEEEEIKELTESLNKKPSKDSPKETVESVSVDGDVESVMVKMSEVSVESPAEKDEEREGFVFVKSIKKVEEFILLQDTQYAQNIESLDLSDPVTLYVDRKKADGVWRRVYVEKDWREFAIGDHVDAQDTVHKWYESYIRDVKETSVYIHFIGWEARWDEWLPKDSSRLAKKGTHTKGPRESALSSYSSFSSGGSYGWSMGGWGSSQEGTPEPSGAVGFQNLGNTCFMNSILQSVMHCPVFVDFFFEGRHDGEINRDNPLGWQGKVADEFAKLVKEYWGNKYTAIAPKSFKSTLGEFQPRFSGYNQQDSSELLSFLLDGLHEDLNLVKKKQMTQTVESNDRPDDVVAREAWETHLKRNESIIVDLFQAQLKSKLTCPSAECGRVSITFDPYLFLSVPLPSVESSQYSFHVVFNDPSLPLTLFGITCGKVCRMSEVAQFLSKMTTPNVPPTRFVFADMWTNKFYRTFAYDDTVTEIRPTDTIFAFEVPEAEKYANPSDYLVVSGVHHHLVKNKYWTPEYSHSREYDLELMGKPFPIILPRKATITRKEVRRQVMESIRRFTVGVTEEPIELTIRGLTSTMHGCYKCERFSSCAGCEIVDDDEIFTFQVDPRDGEVNLTVSVLWGKSSQYNSDWEKSIKKHPSAEDFSGGEGGAVGKKSDGISLTDCIDAFTKPEVLGGEDLWYCNKCKVFQPATKQMTIYSAPPILVIHLKRFFHSRTSRDKINTLVDFPLEGLDFSKYLINGQQAVYDCFAVSNHMGGLGGGHYTAYCKNRLNGEWFLHNDASVHKVTDTKEIISSSAYVLMYKLRGFTQRFHHSLNKSEEQPK